MHRISSLSGILLAVLLLTFVRQVRSQAIPDDLNVIIIQVDDLGWRDIGAYGNEFHETPNIDRLSAEGMRFTNAYAAAAVCSPTRAALLTGKHPARIGITDWIRARFQGGIIPEDGQNPNGYELNSKKKLLTPKNFLFMPLQEITLAELLKEHGYATAHIGKWHLGPEPWFPEAQGFDLNIGGCDLGQPPSYFDPYLPANHNKDYLIPNLEPRRQGEYLTDREGDEAVRFIREHKAERFFLYWAPYTVHTPLGAKADVIEKYSNKQGSEKHNVVYAAMVESLDDNVGKVLEALKAFDLEKETLVIFTSDNGGLTRAGNRKITDNSPLRSGKGYPYEGGLRVPAIMKLPGVIPAGAVSNTPIITMDYLPTIMGLLNKKVKNDREWDGQDLSRVFSRPSYDFRRDLFWHFPHYRGKDVGPYSVIRSGDLKLIYHYDTGTSELYNLQTDPREVNNLALRKEKDAERLLKKLKAMLAECEARLPKEKKFPIELDKF